MGLDIGGYDTRPDWPKLGPSLLIATCLIVAIRTARWGVHPDSASREIDLDLEIDFAAHLSGRVLAALTRKWPTLYPTKQQPWYKADGEDQAK